MLSSLGIMPLRTRRESEVFRRSESLEPLPENLLASVYLYHRFSDHFFIDEGIGAFVHITQQVRKTDI